MELLVIQAQSGDERAAADLYELWNPSGLSFVDQKIQEAMARSSADVEVFATQQSLLHDDLADIPRQELVDQFDHGRRNVGGVCFMHLRWISVLPCE